MMPEMTTSRPPVVVCFVIDELSRAGTETQLLALLKGLDRRRVRPVLCLLKGAAPAFMEMIPPDCPTLTLSLHRLLGLGAIDAALRLTRFWRQHRVQIVQTYFLDSAYFAVPLARLAGISRVVRVRNNVGYWLTRKHRLLGRVIGRLCRATLTNSAEGRDALVRGEHEPASKVRVITNGVDLDRFEGLRSPDLRRASVRIGMVGNLRPVKNVDGLIRSFAALATDFPGITLHIAGEGDQRPALERLIAERQLEGRVLLRGALGDIPAFLGSLDIAVLPSHSESLSNALLEYMAAGRPIVATHVGANSVVIRDGKDGRIVPAKDERAVEMALRGLIDQPEQALQMARSARERVSEDYSRGRMLEEFHQFYEGLMKRD